MVNKEEWNISEIIKEGEDQLMQRICDLIKNVWRKQQMSEDLANLYELGQLFPVIIQEERW